MLALLLAFAISAPTFAEAAKLKVRVPNPEHECKGLLNTDKMPRAQFDLISKLITFEDGPTDIIGFIHSPAKLSAKKADVAENLSLVEEYIEKIHLFRQARWKKLKEYYLQKAKSDYERGMAATAFMTNWDPALLLDGPDSEALAENAELAMNEDYWNRPLDELVKEANKRVLAQPLEDRNPRYLTCDQRLRLIADDQKWIKFLPNFAKEDCGENSYCTKELSLTKGMTTDARDGVRMYLFQWAWYNNGVCEFTKAKVKPPEAYEGPSLMEAVYEAVSKVKCEESCPED